MPEQNPYATRLEQDLMLTAAILAERGVWTGDGAFGADTEQGPVDPIGAAWLASHGNLPYLFTTTVPGAADLATEMVLTDPRVLKVVEFLSANLTDADTRIVDEAPVERIADWVATTSASEAIGRIVRLAEPAHQLAA